MGLSGKSILAYNLIFLPRKPGCCSHFYFWYLKIFVLNYLLLLPLLKGRFYWIVNYSILKCWVVYWLSSWDVLRASISTMDLRVSLTLQLREVFSDSFESQFCSVFELFVICIFHVTFPCMEQFAEPEPQPVGFAWHRSPLFREVFSLWKIIFFPILTFIF